MDIKPIANQKKSFLANKTFTTVLACGVALGVTFGAYGMMVKHVEVVDGKQVYEMHTTKNTVKDALDELGLSLNEGDEVVPQLSTCLENGMRIQINRAALVNVTVEGKVLTWVSTKATVKEVLEEAGIMLFPADKVNPSLDSEIKSGINIRVTRVTEKSEIQQVKLPYSVIKRKNGNMDKGQNKVISKGVDGLKQITYKVIYEDGKETSRQVISEEIVKQSQQEIVEIGTRSMVATSRGNMRFKKVINMKATAYCACRKCTGKSPGDHGYGITHSGMRVRQGVVAVDPRVIPLGSRLYVEGYGLATAQDTGGAIKGNRIDLYFPTHDKTLKYGVRHVKVYVLE
ncbi:MAG TPA: DUF348 domain-containing protein [Thermoanaerobacterales bacterium]|jgi:uncharacterized protein YabE (DUF348 family)|nr:DUF348 domain-containing protein [Thermoanaerobacterales bacterium]